MADIDNVNKESSLLAAWLLDGQGGGKPLGWDEIKNWAPDQGVMWVHLDRKNQTAHQWLTKQTNIDPYIAEAMFEDESRPRYSLNKAGTSCTLNLRSPNLNQDEEIDDMLSVRLWSDGQRIFTTRRLPIRALHDIDEALKKEDGPVDASDFIETLCKYVTENIVSVLSDLEDKINSIEKALLKPQGKLEEFQSNLMVSQRIAINLRRYIIFQPDILNSIENEPTGFMQERDLRQIRDASQKMAHAQSWADSLYDRSFNCQQQIYMRLTTKTGRTTYLLTIVASIFLPLTFLTGLLGTNIGGIPGGDNPLAFWVLSGLCAGIIFVQLLLLRFLKWF